MRHLARHGLVVMGRIMLIVLLALHAAPQTAAADQVIVVSNDRGGKIGARARMLEGMRASQSRIEIRGGVCYSACTMYLGMDNLCISPATVFGFHGPSRNGRALSPAEFEHWSQIMAQYYPAGLREWFLQTARYSVSRVLRVDGASLIRAGYASC
ncbi:hypothetical protein SAMN04488003_11931 [Loktanella fryxellensis]|uniref:Uncharacterized protein n=1 Tax=Loktanella fryxellensis TaxID=245187 RepID=A0A1H8H6K9_9RHOB|nr:hypothetical protein [Loktanella fryxellensis]SEN51128.1 hypothetical protein SAMN04488003_11931 [Loktanella fryxellensis]